MLCCCLKNDLSRGVNLILFKDIYRRILLYCVNGTGDLNLVISSII